MVSEVDLELPRIIAQAQTGESGAFGELYVRYARMVHGILLARVPAGDAEDLVQDVFMSAMRQLRGLRTAAAFRGWLAAIARNRAIDYFRCTRRIEPLDRLSGSRPVQPLVPRPCVSVHSGGCAVIGAAAVGSEETQVRERAQGIIRFLQNSADMELVNDETEYIHFDDLEMERDFEKYNP